MSKEKAQSTIEFTFAMIAMMFLIYGMVMVFRWAGMDLANRRVSQDAALTMPISGNDLYADSTPGDPSVQLNAAGIPALPMSAVYHGTVANGNTSQ